MQNEDSTADDTVNQGREWVRHVENAGCKTAGRHAGSITEARNYGPRRRGEPRTKEIRSQFLKMDQTRETRVPEAAGEGEKSHLDNLSKTAEEQRQSEKP